MSEVYKDRLWTKDFINTSIVNFALMMSQYLLLVTMAMYAAGEYNASVGMAGLVSSAFIIGSLIGRLFGGKHITAMGGKKMLIIGSVLIVILTASYLIPMGIYTLIVLRILHGAAMGYAMTATGTIIAQIIPPSRNGEGIGYFSMSVVLATAVGPLIGVSLIAAYGFTSIFLFSFAMAIISLVIGLTVKAPPGQPSKSTDSGKFKIMDFFEKRAMPISAVMFVMAFAYSGILSYVTAYAESISLIQAGSLYFTVYGITVLLSRPITGPLLDRKGANIVMYPAIIMFAIGLAVISQASLTMVFLIAAALIGFGYGNIQSVTQALAIKVTPPERLGLANTTYFIALDLGLGFGPFLLGYIVPSLGYRGMYMTLAFVVLAGIIVYYFLHGRRDKEITKNSGA
ncbi:MFS transporter [Jeotgalicoccus halotolerans]|uniref:Putative MFS family arabinose efflux permease n=1 Tax=Jeotgalicoccus halotolerans TaxID=157227 RepID=A0A3E0AV18_9STAP|nr:MFS transporter [Jeotgalicoccus halotolerans]REG23521.1 putative MFS family arabinose efflux permease [Jeotgalicoccus halotolerans]